MLSENFLMENYFFKNDSVINNFLSLFCFNLTEEIKSYYEDFGENPLKFRERTLSSIIFPAFMKSGKRAAMELYYYDERFKKRNFLDYYILDKERNVSYLVEFKHAWDNAESEDIDKFNLDKWLIVNDQIDKLNIESVNQYIDSGKEIYGLSIYMLITQSNHKKHDCNSFNNLMQKIQKNFSYDWIYTQKWNKNDGVLFFEENNFYYPFMTLVGKIKKIETF